MREMRKRIMGGVRKCSMCGTTLLFQGFVEKSRTTDIMEKRDICHDCAFWTDLAEHHPKHMEVVSGMCLYVYPAADKNDKSNILGGNGKMRYFMKPDRKVLKSNDIWKIGIPPERFADKFPNTLVEITKRAFNKLTTDNRKCKARGCFDRYECWRYNLELENDSGPFNEVPAGWKTGDEHCRSFIGFNDILGKW